MAFLLRSPFGRTLMAIRENERRARFLGIPVDRHIWIVVGDLVRLRQRRRLVSTRCSATSSIRAPFAGTSLATS